MVTIGVADGVGGWNTLGINPAIFAWDLMETAKVAAQEQPEPLPWNILEEAYDTVKAKGDEVAGSSTACIVTLGKISV